MNNKLSCRGARIKNLVLSCLPIMLVIVITPIWIALAGVIWILALLCLFVIYILLIFAHYVLHHLPPGGRHLKEMTLSSEPSTD
jgi:hypothetical protein